MITGEVFCPRNCISSTKAPYCLSKEDGSACRASKPETGEMLALKLALESGFSSSSSTTGTSTATGTSSSSSSSLSHSLS